MPSEKEGGRLCEMDLERRWGFGIKRGGLLSGFRKDDQDGLQTILDPGCRVLSDTIVASLFFRSFFLRILKKRDRLPLQDGDIIRSLYRVSDSDQKATLP